MTRVSGSVAARSLGRLAEQVLQAPELQVYTWGDSGLNRGPTDYESAALTG